MFDFATLTKKNPPDLEIQEDPTYRHYYIKDLFDCLKRKFKSKQAYLSKIKMPNGKTGTVGEDICEKILDCIENLKEVKYTDDLLYILENVDGVGIAKINVIHMWATGSEIPDEIVAQIYVMKDVFEKGEKRQDRSCTSGHTRMTFFDVKNYLANKGFDVDPYVVVERMKISDKIVEECGYLYNSKIKTAEDWIFNNRDMRLHSVYDSVNFIAQLNEEQRDAYYGIIQSSSKITCLIGNPGTGKSYLTEKIVSYLIHTGNKKIALVSQSASAANNIGDKIAIETREKLVYNMAMSIHRLYYKYKYDKNRDDIEFDYIIVDEASMMDSETFYLLMSIADEKTKFIFVGDSNQLPPVTAGCIFADIINNDLYPVYRLKQVERTDDLKILGVSDALREKNINSDFISSATIDINYHSISQFARFIRGTFCSNGCDFFNDSCLLSHSNTLSSFINYTCVNKIYGYENKPYEQSVSSVTRKSNEIKIYWQHVFREIELEKIINMPIYFTKNDYSNNVFNGTCGRIIGRDTINGNQQERYKNYKFTVRLDSDDIIECDLASCIPAFCSTIHKYQGKQRDNVFYFHVNNTIESWNLIYTACTRAIKNITIFKPFGNFLIAENEERDTYLRALSDGRV